MEHTDYTSHRSELAERIRSLRVEQGLSTRKFSLMIGISRTYLRKLETAAASPTYDMVERIAAGLGVAPHVLVNFDDADSLTRRVTPQLAPPS